jgi:hypothetical protein
MKATAKATQTSKTLDELRNFRAVPLIAAIHIVRRAA